MPSLETELVGLRLKHPFMNASGFYGITAPLLRRVYEAGASAVLTKSTSLRPVAGYDNPTMVELAVGYLNAIGLSSPGAEELAKELSSPLLSGVPVIASIFGSSPEEMAAAGALLAQVPCVKALEINLSCPHVRGVGLEVGSDPDLVAEITHRVKAAVRVPVIVKLSPNVADIVEIAAAAEKAGADALTAVNTLKALAVHPELKRPLLSHAYGGLSGPALKPVALRCVYELYEHVKVPIIGCGGIEGPLDAVEFLLCGARALQVGSALAKRGPGLFSELAQGLASYMEREGFRDIGELVGLAHG
ncbi:MAG: dihydroorotate dehydrogenase [Nitrososphaerota archaeon]